MPTRRFFTALIAGLGVAAIYLLAGKIGLSLAFVNASASAVWPPTGIALATFLVLGYRIWPAVLLGAFLVNITTAGNVATSLGIAAGNTLEGLLGSYLVRRFAGGPGVFEQPNNIFKFTVLAGMLSTAVSATIGVTTLSLGGFAAWPDFWAIWLTWWLGDASGALVVAPLALLWCLKPKVSWTGKQVAEAALLLVTLVTVAWLVFHDLPPFAEKRYPLEYFCLPPLVWAAFRFSQREAATAVAMLSAMAIAGTLRGYGPFAGRPPNESLLLLQGFMAVVSVTILSVAAAVTGRRRIESDIRRLNEETARASLALEQAARLEAEAANRLKDEFLATLSHELRTPLNAIMGWANLLREGRLDPETTARAVETIHRNVRIQSHLISDIMDISRMAVGQLDIRVQALDIAAVVESALDTMRPMAQAKRIVMRSNLARPTRPVMGDPERLQQVVWNLLSNAIKFSPEGGRVTIYLTHERSRAMIRVEDDGPGIPPEFLPHVFERFRQRDSSGTRRHGGLGLGLAIVRHIVELHRGTVSASNRDQGKGAVFSVTLPLVEVPALRESEGEATSGSAAPVEGGGRPAQSLQGTRILLVEDEPDSRELIAMVLTGRGADVVAVGSCREALSAFAKQRPDLLISDIAMPGESGYDLIERLRSLPAEQGGATPAIALTAYAGAEDVSHAHRAGFDAHIAKPVEMNDLIRALKDLMDDRTGRQPHS